MKKVTEQCKKTKTCFECGAINGEVKKAGSQSLRIIHNKFKSFNASTSAKKVPPKEKVLFDASFESMRQSNAKEIERNLKRAMDDLNPLRVMKLFRRIRLPDLELLGLKSMMPENFLWQTVPAPPVCIRPSVGQEGASTEDDITVKLGDIISANHNLREGLEKGVQIHAIMDHWDFLSLQVAMYVNSDIPGLQKAEYGKQIRGFVQRLKGKQGRFRGNLSGKRVDFTARTVISPDPNLAIDEVAVPILIAKNLTYPERVNKHNLSKLKERVRNGTRTWPGANYIYPAGEGFRLYLKFGNLKHIAEKLQEGDVVERHLENGDIVLFNRQPSLHKLSILAHRVRVYPHRTFRLNECDCTPYNADFDGDEMNLHVPQTEEARTEALQLMGVKHNIVTPKNGEPIISAIQDFVTASYLLTSLDNFYDKKTFVATCVGMLEPETAFDLPPPSILKPQMLWTGKQVFNVLMRPNRRSNIRVNIDAQCRDFRQHHEELHNDLQDDSFLCIRNSEIMCGRMDKSTIGAGKKHSLFYIMYRDFGADASAQGMNRLSRLCGRWLTEQAFSVGINDVTPTDVLNEVKTDTIDKVLASCERFKRESRAGTLKRKAGLNDAETLESEQVRVLSTVRTDIAKLLPSQLSGKNSPMIMAVSGAKGSNINVAQMAALLGQQDIEGKRVADGFQDRTLPHFPKNERGPQSKGFVSNSFFSGLNPSEYFFHAIGGRVGLVDTAVKTADTGYMSRRLIKSLEDLSVKYDRTVRTSTSTVVQFRFGDDDLDPVDMEASARPVDLDRTFAHIQSTTFDAQDVGLSGHEMVSIAEDILSRKRAEHLRLNLKAEDLLYDVDDETFTDQHESVRTFLQSIREFVKNKSSTLEDLQVQKGTASQKSSAGTPLTAPNKSKRKSDDLLEDAGPDAEPEPTSTTTRSASTRSRGKVKPTTSNTTSKKRKSTKKLTDELMSLPRPSSSENRFHLTYKISEQTLRAFVQVCLNKYERARVEPGHAVGAVGAQSIGEPGTQMTLKTFHFAGIAGMSLTAGVPRIKEIINASKEISTPIVTCRLERRNDLSIPESFARIIKGRIEKLTLGDVISYIQISHSLDRPSCLYLRVSLETISELGLELTIHDICCRLRNHKKFKKKSQVKFVVKGIDEIKLSVDTSVKPSKRKADAKDENSVQERMLRLQLLRRFLPTIHIHGHDKASRAVVMAEDDPKSDLIKAKRKEMLGTKQYLEVPDDKENLSDSQTAIKTEHGIQLPTSASSRPRSKARAKKGQANVPPANHPIIKIEDDDEIAASSSLQSSSEHRKHGSSQKSIQSHKVIVSGYGLRHCLNTPGVDFTTTTTNSIMETFQVLGIEAARSKIISEIQLVTRDLSIDPRHIQLLADTMTYRGEVLGITRFGLAKTRDSVLQLASFEKTADHVFEAAIGGKVDKIEGVSECVIVGKTVGLGTGMVEVVRGMNLNPPRTSASDKVTGRWKNAVGKKDVIFERVWTEDNDPKGKGKRSRRY